MKTIYLPAAKAQVQVAHSWRYFVHLGYLYLIEGKFGHRVPRHGRFA